MIAPLSIRTCRPGTPSLEPACKRTAQRCAPLLHEVVFHESFLACRPLSCDFAAVAATLRMKGEKSGPQARTLRSGMRPWPRAAQLRAAIIHARSADGSVHCPDEQISQEALMNERSAGFRVPARATTPMPSWEDFAFGRKRARPISPIPERLVFAPKTKPKKPTACFSARIHDGYHERW